MLDGKVVVVTGSNRGIGHSVVEKVAESGAKIVFACARNATSEFEQWCEELGQKTECFVQPIYFDFAKTDEIKDAFRQIKDISKQVDVLVNVAGIVESANFQMTSRSQLDSLFQVNYFAQVEFTQYILKLMTRQRRGSIVFVASSGGLDGNPGRTAYNASKAAVISTVQTLSREMGGIGIRVNAVAPGVTDTDMLRENTPEDVLGEEIRKTCLKRKGTPEEIANVIAFLGSDQASYVTGQVWRVDGGL